MVSAPVAAGVARALGQASGQSSRHSAKSLTPSWRLNARQLQRCTARGQSHLSSGRSALQVRQLLDKESLVWYASLSYIISMSADASLPLWAVLEVTGFSWLDRFDVRISLDPTSITLQDFWRLKRYHKASIS